MGDAVRIEGSRLSGIWSETVALVAPPKCVCCGAAIGLAATVCAGCERSIKRKPFGSPRRRCGTPIDQSFAAFPLEGPVRDLIHALKYRSIPAAANEIARLIADRLPENMLHDAVLVPAPAHPQRLRTRGFNQSELIAQQLGKICDVPVWSCLARRDTGLPQTGLSRARRLALPRDSVVYRDVPRYRQLPSRARTFRTNVVVLDDVTTTGVTLDICAAVLSERMPSQLRAVTFASTTSSRDT
ncbi:MAG: hypothetical protein WAP35_06160 [Solirubrobacterales bacterium]